MKKFIIVALCLSLWLWGCLEQKGEKGVENSNTQSDTMSVVNTPPAVNITSPAYLSTFVDSDLIHFTGIGIDQEDGELAGYSLQWTSIPDDYTETGASFSCSLETGVHMITLKAIDSKGAASSDSTIIIINPYQSDDSPDDQTPPIQKAEVKIYGYITKIKDCDGCIEMLGELKNTGTVDATFCKIKFIFRDKEGAALGSASSYVQGTNKTITAINHENNAILEPDEIGGFMVFTDLPYETVSRYQYAIEWREDETSSPDANFIVDGSISSSDNEYGLLELSGKIKNTGDTTGILGYITFILKDSDGDVIGIAPLNPIKGTPVQLPDGRSTDTAVLPHETGTFTTWSIILYPSEVSDYDYKIKWFDCHETVVLNK